MDLAKVPAHGPHQPARAAADLERLACSPVASRQAFEGLLQSPHYVRCGREELVIALALPAERDVVIGVLPRALVPVVAHLLCNIVIGHYTHALFYR